jgi:hypothetical protein
MKAGGAMEDETRTTGLRRVTVMRYVTPLREGGSMPAIVEADDDGIYVLKFRGAGQGPKALIAELVAGEIARACGLRMPEIVFADLDPDLARTEPDPEIQDLIRASPGLNLAIDYLPGSVTFDPLADRPDAALASEIVWLDAYLTNVDRTARNPNLLMWHRRLWLIDHGAAMYAHHAPATVEEAGSRFLSRSRDRFPMIKDHVLLPLAATLEEADGRMAGRLTPDVIAGVVARIPDAWFEADTATGRTGPGREAYREYLVSRLEAPRDFVEEAVHARGSR